MAGKKKGGQRRADALKSLERRVATLERAERDARRVSAEYLRWSKQQAAAADRRRRADERRWAAERAEMRAKVRRSAAETKAFVKRMRGEDKESIARKREEAKKNAFNRARHQKWLHDTKLLGYKFDKYGNLEEGPDGKRIL